jgi:sulfur relay (sulfurtransferase) DsrF/TusC family protein
MKRRLILIVSSDPRRSGRVAEAVRIAAGVGVWQKVEATLYLRDEAVRALGESSENLVDEDDFPRYWPILAKAGPPVFVQQNAPALRQLDTPALAFTEISDQQLAELAAKQDCVLRF